MFSWVIATIFGIFICRSFGINIPIPLAVLAIIWGFIIDLLILSPTVEKSKKR